MFLEAALEKLVTEIMTPYDIKFLVKPLGANKNKDESTKELFPHRRFFWACGSCNIKRLSMDINNEEGCCGFKIRLLFQTTSPEAKRTPWTTPPQSAMRFAKLLIPCNLPNILAFSLYSSLSLLPISSSAYLSNITDVDLGSR